jgi:hypothetical protein
VSETRKLVAVLVSDVVGYSRLAGADEDRILARLRTLRSDLIDPTIAVHHGRVGRTCISCFHVRAKPIHAAFEHITVDEGGNRGWATASLSQIRRSPHSLASRSTATLLTGSVAQIASWAASVMATRIMR